MTNSSQAVITRAPSFREIATGFFWAIWLLVVALISYVIVATIEVAPYLHMDEFLVVDLGRKLLHPGSDWSIAWMSATDLPVFVWFYLGPVLQELAFEHIGQYGPRVLGLLGGIAAATVLVGWLKARGTAASAAFILGIVFLLDPLFVQGYTMGRVDGWVMALCLASCWILHDAAGKFPVGKSTNTLAFFAGALAAVALYTWPTTVFLLPLILMELFYLARKAASATGKRSQAFGIVGWCTAGGAITAMVLFLPIAPLVQLHYEDIAGGMKVNTTGSSAPGEGQQYLRKIVAEFINLIKNLRYTLPLLLVAIAGCFVRRDWMLIFAAIAATALMLSTIVYIHRVQYLLPYLVVFVGGMYAKRFPNIIPSKHLFRFTRLGVLLLPLAWAIGLSLGVRSMLALDEKSTRERSLVYEAAKTMIGPGNHLVYSPFEFYYPGRSLGWRMYAPYRAVGEPLSPKNLAPVLHHVDYVIMPEQQITPEMISTLDTEGMKFSEKYNIYNTPVGKFDGITTNIVRLRTLYSIHRTPYGPYVLYKRKINKFAKD